MESNINRSNEEEEEKQCMSTLNDRASTKPQINRINYNNPWESQGRINHDLKAVEEYPQFEEDQQQHEEYISPMRSASPKLNNINNNGKNSDKTFSNLRKQ